jgi:hypothetical protein
MSLRSAAFLVVFALCFFSIHQMTALTRDDIPAKPQIASATGADPKCWRDDPQNHVARLGWINDPRANVKLRYNERTKRCVVEITLRVVRDGQIVMLSRSVGNAEGREYAHFIWKAAESEEPSGIFCEVFLPSGEEMDCHSESEFEEVVSSLSR